jgi:RNA polymerase sigma-70 factor (ECF subfamily)
VDQSDSSQVIQGWLDRLRSGDDSARDALFEAASQRLTRLARKMLRDFPGVGRWEETDDVLQNALVRLDRALRSQTPATPPDFFRLAASIIRRELIDLSRRYQGPEGLGAHHASVAGDSSRPPFEGAGDSTFDAGKLALWTEFHAQVERMPDEDRALFDLLWYQGLQQSEAATLLGMHVRQVSRRWMALRLQLAEALGGQLPV